MLAFKWQDHRTKVTYPVLVQPKLDGVRCLYRGGTMQSRSSGQDEPKIVHESRLIHIREALQHLPDNIILDGEIYVHGWSLQKINQQFSVNSTEPRPHETQLQYYVSDCIDLNDLAKSQDDRTCYIKTLIQSLNNPTVRDVTSFYATDEYQVESYFRTFRDHGFEGAIIRDHAAPYGLSHLCGNKENRWKYLLKRKDWLDEIYEIKEVQEGEGKHLNRLGSLLLALPNGGEVSVGTGFSDSERDSFWANPPIGKKAHVKFDSFSDAGVPLKPTFLEII